ncbi:serine/threonine-protein kinase [Acrasis kona]|uniref:Serine/threonine-protein kinase n=1 Tax=Acrasis kona TaxID=1008807 RepID=A0AAW2ZNB3_9EUKA
MALLHCFFIFVIASTICCSYNYISGYKENDGLRPFTFSSGQTLKRVLRGVGYQMFLTQDGSIYSSGNSNNEGQLGIGYFSDGERNGVRPIRVAPNVIFGKMCTGHSHSAAVTKNGEVYVWGSGENGKLGLNSTLNHAKPTLLHQLKNIYVQSVACGQTFTLALTTDGLVYGWGRIPFEQRNNTSPSDWLTPKQTKMNIDSISDIVAGGTKTFIFTLKNELYVHFDSSVMRLVNVTNFSVDRMGATFVANNTLYLINFENKSLVEMNRWDRISSLMMCDYHQGLVIINSIVYSFDLKPSGSLYEMKGSGGATELLGCEGSNVGSNMFVYISKDQVVHSNVYDFSCPSFALMTLDHDTIDHVTPSRSLVIDKSYVLDNNNKKFGPWGASIKKFCSCGIVFLDNHELVDLYKETRYVNNDLVDVDCVQFVGAVRSLVAVATNGSFYYTRNFDNPSQAVKESNLFTIKGKSVVSACLGAEHVVLLTSDHQLYSFGANNQGQLGVGSLTFKEAPTLIKNQLFKSIKCGAYSTAAISDDNKVFFWGMFVPYPFEGTPETIGIGLVPTTIPKQIHSSNLTFKSISIGYTHILAVGTDDELYVYGNNQYGQLGYAVSETSSLLKINLHMQNKSITNAFAAGYSSYIATECSDGYYGDHCTVWDCKNIKYDNSQVCNSFGKCIGPDTCLCKDGYEQVEQATCQPVCSDGCNGRRCLSPENCDCNVLFFNNSCAPRLSVIVTLPIVMSIVIILLFVTVPLIIKHIRKLIKNHRAQEELRYLLQDQLVVATKELNDASQSWMIKMEDLKFLDRIAQGTFGVVFKGKHLGTTVAIKLIKDHALSGGSSDTDVNKETFTSEVKIMKSLHHPNIVQFLGVCINNDQKLIITEFMDGLSLQHIINACRENIIALPFTKKIQLLTDVALGMNYLHSITPPLCHRDLKLSNILVNKSMSVAKICDFGISKFDTNNTMTGNVGTLRYMAPEVFKDEPYDIKCDVYSFGIVMFEVMFEYGAYSDDFVSVFGMIEKVRNGVYPQINQDVISTESQVRYVELMKTCWSIDPDERPSFSKIIDQLNTLEDMSRIECTIK